MEWSPDKLSYKECIIKTCLCCRCYCCCNSSKKQQNFFLWHIDFSTNSSVPNNGLAFVSSRLAHPVLVTFSLCFLTLHLLPWSFQHLFYNSIYKILCSKLVFFYVFLTWSMLVLVCESVFSLFIKSDESH